MLIVSRLCVVCCLLVVVCCVCGIPQAFSCSVDYALRFSACRLPLPRCLQRQEDALEPFTKAIHQMIEQVHREEQGADHPADHDALQSTLIVVLLALGQSLIGHPLSSALKLPDHTARDIAERFVVDSLEQAGASAP